MKKSEQPEFSAKWWKDNQPNGLKSANALGSALKDYEKAKHKLESTAKASVADDVWDALDEVKQAVKAVIAEASKAKDNAEMNATVDCLNKFDRSYAQEENWIEAHTKGGTFTDPEAYHDYLVTVLKRLRNSRGMNFGLVLGKKAEDHRLALHRSKAPRALAMTLAKETGIQQMTFGTARPDKDDTDALVLTLEGKQLPGMAKKGERMLMKMMPMPFKKMSLEVEGKQAKDLDDPDDTGR